MPPGGNILICFYNILRNTEETSSKHHTTTTYVEPQREEKRKAEKHVAEKHPKRKKENWATKEQESKTGLLGPSVLPFLILRSYL